MKHVMHMMHQDAASLATVIEKIVQQQGLRWANCVGQCYDGAAVMSGIFSGVQARICEKHPHVLYFHCYAHRLNLVLVSTIRNNVRVEQFFVIVQKFYTFILLVMFAMKCSICLKKN